MFSPLEKLENSSLAHMVFVQIVLDVFSNDCIRFSKEERRSLSALLGSTIVDWKYKLIKFEHNLVLGSSLERLNGDFSFIVVMILIYFILDIKMLLHIHLITCACICIWYTCRCMWLLLNIYTETLNSLLLLFWSISC